MTDMKKYFLSVACFAGLILMNSCSMTDDRESKANEYLQQKINSESKGALKLDNFQKTNGYDQDIMGMKIYVLEWTADVSTIQECWKYGNLVEGYWGNFSVWTQSPSGWEAQASLHKHFGEGANIRLTGDSKLQKTEQGWRVEAISVKTSQILDEGSTSSNSSGAAVNSFIGIWKYYSSEFVDEKGEKIYDLITVSENQNETYVTYCENCNHDEGREYKFKVTLNKNELIGKHKELNEMRFVIQDKEHLKVLGRTGGDEAIIFFKVKN